MAGTKHIGVAILLAGSIVFAFAQDGAIGSTGTEWRSVEFDNGFRLLMKEDHSSPMAASIITVKAGSVFEDESTYGLSHFLEHLLFDGTDTRSRQEIWNGIQKHGGYINAFTRKTATVFILLMPSEFLDFGLEIQSDMLFNSILPVEELPKERKVVIEEINQSKDSPDFAVETACENFFNAGTRYSKPVLGYRNLIETVPRSVILEYYKRMYVPSNMTALCMGDFDPIVVEARFRKYFENIPAEAQSQYPEYEPEFIAGGETKRQEGNFYSSRVEMAWRAPGMLSEDYINAEILAEILNSGKNSPLVTGFPEGEAPDAGSISVWLEPFFGFSLLRLSAIPGKAEDPESLLVKINTALDRLPYNHIDKELVETAIVGKEADYCRNEEKFHYFGMMQALHLVLGKPEMVTQPFNGGKIPDPATLSAVAGRIFGEKEFRALILEQTEDRIDSNELHKMH